MQLSGYIPNVGKVAGYMFLPRILPRLYEIGFRFTFVAVLMASLYATVGLLPRNHPFLRANQHGRFSVRQVFVEAARHLKFDIRHIDQIIMFGVLLAGFLLLVAQFFFMGLYLVMGIAQAASVTVGFDSMFQTRNPTNDIALMLLDRVFGVPGYFNSCISTATLCEATGNMIKPAEPLTFPEGHQIAMQTLFAYFSTGAMLLGGIILAYYIIVVTLESAQTGVPFGKRFSSIYAPMRLCLAVLMLVPMPTPGVGLIGYNSAQYLTLYLAGVGSAFGTNLWITFNNTFISGGVGVNMITGYGPVITSPVSNGQAPGAAMVAQPTAPMIDQLLQFMMIARSCREMYTLNPPSGVAMYAQTNGQFDKSRLIDIDPYIIAPDGYMKITGGVTYETARNLVRYGDIRIRIGIDNADTASVTPFCGELLIRAVDTKKEGAKYLQEKYFTLIHTLWVDPDIVAFSRRMALMHMTSTPDSDLICEEFVRTPQSWGEDEICGPGRAGAIMPSSDFYQIIREPYQALLAQWVKEGHAKQIAGATGVIDNKILNRGWAGAGIWYNKLAEVNGSLFDAAKGMPVLHKMPVSMENIARQNRSGLKNISSKNQYTVMPVLGQQPRGDTLEIATALNVIYIYFQDGKFQPTDLSSQSGNVIFDLMNSLFGTRPLFDMRNDVTTNPLVQMIALGKSIVDAAFFNIMVGMGIETAGGALEQLDQYAGIGKGLNVMGDAWFSVATLGLGIGIMLYYVIPFMPFIYFFFAVIKWLQSIFEAMIGMPLWALAHLRIDGDGIPPDGAMQGYFLLFEIVIRPALTVIGMIASFVIFTGLAYTMNDIFDLMVVNLTGYNPPSVGSMTEDLAIKKGTVDQFFYTVVYTVLMYMMAVSCFKLIDRIPKEILRWIGSDAKNILDEGGDAVGGLIQQTYIGAFGMPLVQSSGPVGQAIDGLRKVSEGSGKMVGQGLKGILKKGNTGVQDNDS